MPASAGPCMMRITSSSGPCIVPCGGTEVERGGACMATRHRMQAGGGGSGEAATAAWFTASLEISPLTLTNTHTRYTQGQTASPLLVRPRRQEPHHISASSPASKELPPTLFPHASHATARSPTHLDLLACSHVHRQSQVGPRLLPHPLLERGLQIPQEGCVCVTQVSTGSARTEPSSTVARTCKWSLSSLLAS